MAIDTGTALAREVSAETLSGLQMAVASAMEDNLGYDKDGGIQRAGGTNQRSHVDFKWRGSVRETLQTFKFDYSSIANSLTFAGTPVTRGKVQRVTFSGTQEILSNKSKLRVVLGSVTKDIRTHDDRVSSSDVARVVAATLNNNAAFSSIVALATVSGSVMTVTYNVNAGDLEFPTSIKLVSAVGSHVLNTFTAAVVTTTQYRTPAVGGTLTAKILNNTALTGAHPLGISSFTQTKTVQSGTGITSNDLAVLIEKSVQTQVGYGSAFYDGSKDLRFTLISGYALSKFIIQLKLVRNGMATVTHNITAAFTGAGTTTYVAGLPESYGTFTLNITDPNTDRNHPVTVTFDEDEQITDVETKITSAIRQTVIDDEGTTVGSFVKIFTSGAPTDGVDGDGRDVSEFRVNFVWTDTGAAGITVTDTDMTDVGSDFSAVTDTATGTNPSDSDRIGWNVTTSSTLQPGGNTVHYAVLTYLQT